MLYWDNCDCGVVLVFDIISFMHITYMIYISITDVSGLSTVVGRTLRQQPQIRNGEKVKNEKKDKCLRARGEVTRVSTLVVVVPIGTV